MTPEQDLELIEMAFERQAEELAALRVHHQREMMNLVNEMIARRSASKN